MLAYQDNPVGVSCLHHTPTAYIGDDSITNAAMWQGFVGNINSNITPMNDNNWHHLVITGNVDSQNVYIDNVMTGRGAGINFTSNATQIYNQIGTSYAQRSYWQTLADGWNYFKGSIDDFKVYDRVLTVEEVDSLFNEANPVASAIQSVEQNSVNIFPNPTKGQVYFSEPSNVSLIDINGSILLEETETAFLELSQYSSGMYFLVFKDNKGNITQYSKLMLD